MHRPAVSQAVGVVTGIQDKFSFTGVAAAGLSAGVGNLVAKSVGGKIGEGTGEYEINPNSSFGSPDFITEITRTTSSFTNNLLSSAASAITNAATRSALQGSSFGKNLVAAIPDVIGQSIGRVAGAGLAISNGVQFGVELAFGAPDTSG